MIEYVVIFDVLQSVDVVKYTDEEYEKHLADPVGIKWWLNVLVKLVPVLFFVHSFFFLVKYFTPFSQILSLVDVD